ncbi:MFS transporter [Oceanispirochaeta crateris]|uniref:MFS transporter n=1 Tax=Oceanispirochaeta crateris TaxID=2518645 RepID=A0A5C1QM61_9SPIO|nr:MFS transporter [Oceanispirochaeta crateris]QEN08299.1 MFS transporter [Oceanispirochaeta crateris]
MNKKTKMLWVLGLMAFLANGDNYAAASLLADIAGDLGLQLSTAALSVTSYMMAFGAFTLLFGPLSDRFGKANIINTAAMGTAVFSILGALSFNLPSLLLFRGMNGVFGAGIFPVTMALIGENFDDHHRQKALGMVMGLAFMGAASATTIGGAMAFLGSWRLVYLIYGIGELILAIFMLKLLERDKAKTDKLNLFSSYRIAFTNFRFMRLVSLLFLVGFTILGSFTYAGILLSESTNLNSLFIGLILSIFGIGTVVGGRVASGLRKQLGHGFLVYATLLGSLSFFLLASEAGLSVQILGFFGFGLSFIFLQSTIIATAQEKLPAMKGTAMSLAGFNMFLGGALGTFINGQIIDDYGVEQIFFNSALLIFVVGLLAAVFVARFEIRKKKTENHDDQDGRSIA